MAKFMKNLFLIFVTVTPLFLFLNEGKAIIDRIAAIVNQEIITLSEVERYAEHYKVELKTDDRFQRREEMRKLYGSILDKLIEEKLIEQEAKRLGIKVTSKEIDTVIEDLRKRNALSQEDLEKELAKEGMKLEDFRKQIEKKLQNTKLINLAIKIDLNPDGKKLREFYEKNIGLYQKEELYRPAHIFFAIPKDAAPEEIQKIKRKCQNVLEKIRQGEDFGEMALIYSEDPSSKDKGDLGFFKKGELMSPLEKALLQLKVGEVSDIIRTEFGFHIIKLIDKKGGGPLPFEEVSERVKRDFMEAEMEKALKQFLKTLKEKSVIEIKL